MGLLLTAFAITTPPAGAAFAASTPTCGTSRLVVWLDTSGNGAAGSVFYKLEFTNLSAHTCSLLGYPGVSAVDVSGRQLGSSASRDASRTPRVIRLLSGATVAAALRIVDTRNFSPSTCRPVTAAGLRIYPPNATNWKLIPFPFSACSRGIPIYMSVQAVRGPSALVQTLPDGALVKREEDRGGG
jgi:hypothetical protein